MYLAAGDSVLHDFVYDEIWHPTTDGDGPSMQVVHESANDLNSWNTQAGWQPSSQVGGSPGTADGDLAPIPGDSNHDGVFDSSDFVFVFKAGEYEDSVSNNSTFEEGDWNGDGDFDTSDFVYAFTEGDYDDGGVAAQKTAVSLDPQLHQLQLGASLLGNTLPGRVEEKSKTEVPAIEFEDAAGLDLLIQFRERIFDDLGNELNDRPQDTIDDDLLEQLTSDL